VRPPGPHYSSSARLLLRDGAHIATCVDEPTAAGLAVALNDYGRLEHTPAPSAASRAPLSYRDRQPKGGSVRVCSTPNAVIGLARCDTFGHASPRRPARPAHRAGRHRVRASARTECSDRILITGDHPGQARYRLTRSFALPEPHAVKVDRWTRKSWVR
jgi:hypothetical protein